MVNDRQGIIHSDHAFGLLLNVDRSLPWLVDILGRVFGQDRYVFSNVLSIGISLFAECDRTVNSKILKEEGRSAQPHPVCSIQAPVSIQEQVFEHFLAFLPRLVQVSSRKEASNRMSCQMMNPTFLSELSHNGVDERIASLAILPRLKEGLVFIPLDLLADWVSFYLIEVGSKCSVKKEELAPDELSFERNWRKGMLAHLFVDFLDSVIEQPAAKNAELEVRT